MKLVKYLIMYEWYSVMQSKSNSFWGDVVLDSFNMVNRDEDIKELIKWGLVLL